MELLFINRFYREYKFLCHNILPQLYLSVCYYCRYKIFFFNSLSIENLFYLIGIGPAILDKKSLLKKVKIEKPEKMKNIWEQLQGAASLPYSQIYLLCLHRDVDGGQGALF